MRLLTTKEVVAKLALPEGTEVLPNYGLILKRTKQTTLRIKNKLMKIISINRRYINMCTVSETLNLSLLLNKSILSKTQLNH